MLISTRSRMAMKLQVGALTLTFTLKSVLEALKFKWLQLVCEIEYCFLNLNMEKSVAACICTVMEFYIC